MSDAAWRALRARLGGPPAPPVSAVELARVAVQGEVLALVAEDDPEVAALAAEDLTHRVFNAMHVARAGERVAACLAGMPTALLKGSATAFFLYDDPAHRFSRDVDVLVHDRDFDGALERLREDGWTDAVGRGFARTHGRRPWQWALARAEGPVRVACDVHRRLSRPGRFALDGAAIMRRARAAPGAPLPVCHPEDALLHGVVHAAAARFRVPLKSWVDIARLVGHQEVELDQIAARAVRQRVRHATWAALLVAERWLGAAPDAQIMSRLRPPPGIAGALERALSGDGALPSTGRVPVALLDALLCDGPRAGLSWARHGTLRVLRSVITRERNIVSR